MAHGLTVDELLENASHDVVAAQRGGGKRDYAYQQGVMTGLLRAKSSILEYIDPYSHSVSDLTSEQADHLAKPWHQHFSEAPIG